MIFVTIISKNNIKCQYNQREFNSYSKTFTTGLIHKYSKQG